VDSDFKISLDELRERVKSIKIQVDKLHDDLYRQHYFERGEREIQKADAKFSTAEFHD
jgi:hypothetical protein